MVRVCQTAVIDAPVDEVWRILRDFNSHHAWHPAIATSRIEDGHPADQVGAVRAFTLADGGFLREQLISLDDRARTFSYCLLEAPLPLFGYVATVTLRPVTDTGQTFWKWESRFRTTPARETELRDLVANGIYLAGMRALETWMRQGRPTPTRPNGGMAVERSHERTAPWTPPRETPVTPRAASDRAIVMARHGGPDVLQVRPLDPVQPGPGEVQIRQSFIGVNFIDIYCRTGYFDLVRPPGVPGMEASGTVTAVGEGVNHLSPGDRVAYACGPTGAYASIRTMAADLVVRLPASLPDDIAAAGLLKGVTAGFLLHDVHVARAGEIAVVHAAAGGVGSLLVQWASALGLRVIATVSTHEKAARARAMGAEEVIVGRGGGFVDTVMEITQDHGADVIFDAIGRDSFDASIAALALRGHLVSFGQASGDIGPREIGPLASKSVTLSRPNYGHYTGTRAEMARQAERLFRALDAGHLVIDPPTVFALDQAAEAHRELEAGRTTGSLVLRV